MSDWADDDSEDSEHVDLEDVVFGPADGTDESATSSIDSIDEFEIDDSFLDPDDEADWGSGQQTQDARSTGRSQGQKTKTTASN